MAITSSSALIDALRVHQLLSPDRLAQLPHLARERSGDVRALAKLLGQRGWLTIYQINKILHGGGKDLRLGPYLILERLGEGGLSQVFRARHFEHDWIVALKAIRPECMADDAGRAQFLHEMEAMARLDHVNIVQFCDLDQAGEIFYYAMEFLDGIDLAKHVGLCGPLPVAEACDYARQTALGLQHAHERNLVHRDIKPVNLLLMHVTEQAATDTPGKTKKVRHPLIKILDWGLAGDRFPKARSSEPCGQTTANGILGTADYLSPEQARNHETVDIRGDIYSLGCTLYYMLSGQAPYPTGTLMQKILLHQQGEPAPLDTFRDDVPDDVNAILKRMMARDPDARFQTPAAVALAMAPFARGEPPGLNLVLPRVAALRKDGAPRGSNVTPLPIPLGNARRAARPGSQDDTVRP